MTGAPEQFQINPGKNHKAVSASCRAVQFISVTVFWDAAPPLSLSGVCPVPFLCCTTGDDAQKAVQC